MKPPVIDSVAKALIINEYNEALILTIGVHKTKPEKSFMLDLPGGIVDQGETEYEAVIREIQEETDITISPDALIMVYSKTVLEKKENKSVTRYLFTARINVNPLVKLSWEHSAYEWVPVEKLTIIRLGSFYDEAIEYCLANGLFPFVSDKTAL